MKRTSFFAYLFLASSLVFAQNNFTVTGIVIDAETKQSLPGATVFCQNTTQGTTSNKEGEFKLELKTGGYELIISYSGYQTKLIRVSNDEKLSVELVKEDKSLSEVVITSSNEVPDGWEKYGQFFTDHFIGTTPFSEKCTLKNAPALKFYFYKRSNKLKVLATEPLVVENKALGYKLRYQLDSFVYYYKTDISSYRGYCFFSEDSSGSIQERRVWKGNREKAYYGSRLHFMRSYYDSTLEEDGYLIDLLDEKDDTKFNRVVNPYDTAYYLADDSTREIEIFFPRKLSVTYKKVPEATYLKQFKLPAKVATQISYVDLLNGIAIKQNGFFYDQNDWVNQGYWSWKNLGDLLPYDYLPD